MQILRLSLLLLLVAGVFAACDKNEKEPLTIPAAYDGANFNANAATESGVRGTLTTLVNEMKKGRTPGVVLTYDNLNLFYASNGNPTLLSVTTPYYGPLVNNNANGFLLEMAKASGAAYLPGPPVGEGGTYGGYLFDENGLEMEQMVEKGLFGALLFQHFHNLATGAITEATVDQMVAIFGAHPDFPNSFQANLHANPDIFSANYAARRDKNDGNGYYTRIRDQFITLQAAVKAGSDYNEERDQAIAEIRRLWELSNAATIVNYCQSAISKLSATNPTDADKASALHSLGEAIGFLHGWRTLPNKIITDAQIDQILALLNAPQSGTASVYTFVADPLNQLPKLTQAIDQLASVYGFTPTEIEDFKKNWVLEQNR